MFETIFNFVKNHISVIISLISLALSSYNFIYLWYVRRVKVKIDLVTYNFYKENNLFTNTFCIDISNCSQLPISINRISIDNIFCTHNKRYFKRETHTQKDKILAEENTFTFQFPINLGVLESTSGYVEFLSNQKLDLNQMKFTVYTNRSNPQKVTATKLHFINDKDTSF